MQLGLDSLDMVELVAKINEGLSPLVRPPLLTMALLTMALLTMALLTMALARAPREAAPTYYGAT